jgi:hypothetical protein
MFTNRMRLEDVSLLIGFFALAFVSIVQTVRFYGVTAVIHREQYRGRRAGTGRGVRFRRGKSRDYQRHSFAALFYANTVEQVLSNIKLIRLPEGHELYPCQPGSMSATMRELGVIA